MEAVSAPTNYGAIPAPKELLRSTEPNGSKKGSSNYSWHLKLTVSIVALCATLATFLQFHGSTQIISHLQNLEQAFNLTSSGIEELGFEALNKYTVKYGASASYYPWVDAPVLEPYREATFAVTGSDDAMSYNWELLGQEENEATLYNGNSLTITFKSLDVFQISIVERDAANVTSRNFVGKVIVRYVRRELRTLDEDDREMFMQAAAKLWSVSMSDGMEAYGSDFKNIQHLTMMHNHLAGDRACDHMHDGLGFMTQHASLTYAFEKSLQSIDPGVTVPYWDWTIDVARNAAENLTNSAIWDWDVWKAEYFGSANSDNTVGSGRWAYIEIVSDNWNETHNPYGYMRAPWNMNSQKWVTRYNFTGSLKHRYDSSDMGMPTCMDFWTLLMTCDTWYDFGWALPYDPHARVHSVIGGSESGESFNKIAKYVDDDDTLSLMAKLQFSWTKNMWRSYELDFPEYCSSDTPQHQCKGSCTNLEDSVAKGDLGLYINTFSDDGVKSTLNAMDFETQTAVIEALCTNALSIGDQMESASPSDISFWPIHPNLERIWMIKKLSDTFSDESWPFSGTSLTSSSGENCYGHGAHDLLPLGDIYGYPSSLEKTNLTNMDLYHLMDPMNDNLPYVYDDFTLDHCDRQYNLDFSTWLPEAFQR